MATAGLSSQIATRASVPLTISPTPEASPSIPSIRFQMLMQARNQNSVTHRPGMATCRLHEPIATSRAGRSRGIVSCRTVIPSIRTPPRYSTSTAAT